MEFLTPQQKRWRTFRFILGYILIAIAVLLATFISILLVQGYQLSNRKQIIQNGLVNVESRPVSAEVFLNGKKVDNTTARLDINEGNYELKLTANDYRTWSKNFELPGGSIRYFTYPKLIPNKIATDTVVNYAFSVEWASPSPDRHWLLSKGSVDQPKFSVFDTTRVSRENRALAIKEITLPASVVLSEANSFGKFEAVEWSDDNKHVLLLQTLSSGQKAYLILDREKPENSVNVTKTLALAAEQKVTLRDKKYDKFYVLNVSSGVLTSRELKSPTTVENIAEGVVTYKSFGDNLVMYVTYSGATTGYAKVLVKNNVKDTYNLQPLPRDANNSYQLDMAKFDGNWYYATSSSSDRRVRIYVDPLSSGIKPNANVPIQPRLSMYLQNPQFIQFSDNARFISGQSGNRFTVYDGELKRIYRYEVPFQIAADQQVKWMDGHRFKVVVDGKVKIFEFDGMNGQELTASLPNNNFNAFFDRDYEYVFTYQQGQDGKALLQAGSLVVSQNFE